MARWIIRTVGKKEVLRVREGQQFEWAKVIYTSDFAAVHSDEQIEALGFTVLHLDDIAPPPTNVPLIASRLQFFRALARRGLISQAEALAAVTVNAIPTKLLEAIEELPEEQRFDATMIVAGAAEFDRSHPLTEMLGLKLMSADEITDFFAFAKTL